MKYILVHWTATNETSILTEEFVRDKSMLKDVNKEGMVRFGKLGCKEPKGGWKAYLGRVIFVNERKQLVKLKEEKFLREYYPATIDNIEDYDASNHNRRKRKISSSDSELSNDSVAEESNSKPKKKIADARNAAQNRAFESIIERMEPEIFNEPDSYDIPENEKLNANEELKEKIMELQKELAKERSLVMQLQDANLMLQRNLPDLLKKTCKEVIKEVSFVADRNKGRPHSPLLGRQTSSPSSLSQRSPCSPTVFSHMDHSTPRLTQRTEIVKSKQVAPEATSLRCSDDINSDHDSDCTTNGDADGQQRSSTCPDDSLPPLSNFADSVQVSEIKNSRSDRKMSVVLMCILFKRSVIASSSVTGKSKEGRPALDPQKVQLIISHVLKRFPKATPSTVKAAMAQKCKDERNATECRKLKAEKTDDT